MDKTQDNRAWFLVLPVVAIVAGVSFSAATFKVAAPSESASARQVAGRSQIR